MKKRYFKIHYNDGVFAEEIVFTDKTDKEIKTYLQKEIDNYSKNPNTEYHITMNNIKEVFYS